MPCKTADYPELIGKIVVVDASVSGRLWILLLNQKKIMIVLMVNQMTAMTDAQFYEQKNNAETFG
jgi:hypothetical protein